MAKISMKIGVIAKRTDFLESVRFFRASLPGRRGTGFIYAQTANGQRHLVETTCRQEGKKDGLTDHEALEIAMGKVKGLDPKHTRGKFRVMLAILLSQEKESRKIRRWRDADTEDLRGFSYGSSMV